MMKHTASAWLLLVLISLCGCTGNRHEVNAWTPGSGVKVTLRVDKHEANRLELTWKFENHLPYAVFLPTRWGWGDWVDTPAVLIMPPSDMLLAYDVHLRIPTEQGLNVFIGPGFEFQRVGPGQSTGGRLTVPLPFEYPEIDEDPQPFRSVFMYPEGYPDDIMPPTEREA